MLKYQHLQQQTICSGQQQLAATKVKALATIVC